MFDKDRDDNTVGLDPGRGHGKECLFRGWIVSERELCVEERGVHSTCDPCAGTVRLDGVFERGGEFRV